ncbi:MAG: hypothetical protein CMJ84_16465 [Planctomycetes bacterium]|jgi:hypothetical protein|nr:hypothetical protein [Planctomycetota bacterium]MDP6409963.1 PmoA family protein [Planctomycetota bacterium]
MMRTREVWCPGAVGLAVAVALTGPILAQEPARFTVTVDPGGVDRSLMPVSLCLDRGAHLDGDVLTPERGEWVCTVTDVAGVGRTVQVEAHREADLRVSALSVHWVEESIVAGSPAVFELELSPLGEGAAAPETSLGFEETPSALTLTHGEHALWRHELGFDPDRIEETYKTFHHVLDGETVLTKGLGGLYPHHRGLFIGWSKTRAAGRTHNFWWNAKGASHLQRHAGFVDTQRTAGPLMARSVSLVEWLSSGSLIVSERRGVTTWNLGPGRWSHEFEFVLQAAAGEVRLDGDPAHGGFQFRAAQEVAEREDCAYVLPLAAQGGENDNWTDCPWAAARITIGGHPYWIVHMNAPSNPGPTTYNTRSYGRFGSFFRATIPADGELRLRYRVLVIDGAECGELREEVIARAFEDFATPVSIEVSRQ